MKLLRQLDIKKYILPVSISILIFSFDRIIKNKVIEHQLNNERLYINDYINLELVWNTGIAFGLLSSNSDIFYNIVTILICCVILILVYFILSSKFLDRILFSIILGGALGNLCDRILFSAVPDFIDIHYQRFHWFTFNIADIFISIGILMLIFKDLFLKNANN